MSDESEQLLRRLLEEGFYVTHRNQIAWGFIEDVTIAEVFGDEFEAKIGAYMPRAKNRERV